MFHALKKIPYKFDIFIIAAIVVFSIIEHIHIDRIFYYSGCINYPPIAIIPYGFLYEILKIVVVLIAVIRLLFRINVCKKQKKYYVTALLTVAIYINGCMFLFTFNQPGAVHFLKGFGQWVSQNVEVDVIQTWIQSEDADKFLGNGYDKDDFPGDLPDFITNFNPEYVFFHNYDFEKGKCVEFKWFTLGESWGIVIGPPTMEVETEGRFPKGVSEVEFRRFIKPGIFIYDAG